MNRMPEQFQPSGPGRSSVLALRQAQLLQTAAPHDGVNEETDDSLDIRALLGIVLKHKWLLLSITLLCLTAALVKALISTPMYQASTLLQIDRSSARILSFNRDVDPSQDGYDFNNTQLTTQIELLRSRALAEKVVDDLNLDSSRVQAQALPPRVLGGASAPAFAGAADSMRSDNGTAAAAPQAGKSPAGEPSGPGMLADLKNRLIDGYEKLGNPSVTDKQVLGREAVVRSLMGSVTIVPVRNSRLVRINAISADPAKAARVANAMAQGFIAMSAERRLESSAYARNFLEDQIKVMKARLEESERTLNTYAKANSILTLDSKTNVVNQTFTDFATELSRVEMERQKIEAQYNELARNPENSAQVLANLTIQAYKEQKAKLQAEYVVNLGVYKAEFPKMVQARAQIADLDTHIKAEVAAVLASVKAQFDALKHQEDQVRARVQDTRRDVLVAQDRGVDMSLLKRELDTNRQLYDNLLQRLKEVGVTSSLATNNISVADAATTPLFPFKPNLLTSGGIGMTVGLMLGLGLIFMREQLDDSIKHPDEVERNYGLPLLGIIPQVKKKQTRAMAQLTVDDPRSTFAEAYRSMRTALQFSTAEGAPKRLLVTSSVQGEGKSTTALALAINFAQLGKRVLLLDADMRNPTVHEALGLDNDRGLSNFLTSEGPRESLIRATSIANLSVMTAGPLPPSPVDLLMGPKLLRLLDRAEEMGFDQVVIDSPPILGIADAIVLGNQIQNILFVMRAGATRRSSIKDALRRLHTGGLLPLGVALTQAASLHTAYEGYEGYYGYGNDKGTGNEAGAAKVAQLDRSAA